MREEEEIEDLVYRFSSAVGNYDRHLWASTWARDGLWSLGDGREFNGRERIVDAWSRIMLRYREVTESCLHGNCDLDEPTGTGRGRWYVERAYLTRDRFRSVMLAHYDDSYVIEGGEWRFATRRMVRLYHGPSADGQSELDFDPI